MNNYQELKKIKLRIKGMSSKSSEDLIVQKFKQIEGIERAYAHFKKGKGEIFCSKEPNIQELQNAVGENGFRVFLWDDYKNRNREIPSAKNGNTQIIDETKNWVISSRSINEYFKVGAILIVIIGLYLVLKQFSFVPQIQNLENTNLLVIFLTGLTIGGLTCLAVQGGLLASTIAQREEEEIEGGKNTKNNLLPVAAFLGSKLVAYTILGFGLGAFGKVLSITPSMQTNMQLVAGFYMILVALNLLNVHPIFRYAIIQPPRFLTRMVRNQSKSKDLFAPGLLGLMTIFIPCGTTLAMEALAISSANPILGASTMAVFTIGTMPLFFGLGFLTTSLGDTFRGKFIKFAAFAVIYLGVNSVNGALIAKGSPLTLQSVTSIFSKIDLSKESETVEASSKTASVQNVQIVDGVQVADIKVYATRYDPKKITVKAGTPVKMNLSASGPLGCTSVFVIPSLGITEQLARTGTGSVEFTPEKKGKVTWTCAMGMYRGTMEVI